MNALILKPTQGEPVYDEAAGVFQAMYEKITGVRLAICEEDDGVSDLFVIGSDAVNDFVMNEMFEQRLSGFGIRYGTDDYAIRSCTVGTRKVVYLAGGRGRSTLYAVYDYFERYAGCHYFWDGDVIPKADSICMDNIDICESPRFEYRGLRYFAHRGLKRFQAEHWSFTDWKQEIDWMLKKRLNFFMMRIGMDDVWQRAFPDTVPYPETYRTADGVNADTVGYEEWGGDVVGYDDRSDFWTPEYRGKLREQILAYARLMDLTYPTDCGTMTHWYSRTPAEYLETYKPKFLAQADNQYVGSETGCVWDFRKEEEMSRYMHLTETMVQEYEKQTGLFHTIGLGERRMFKEKEKNFALKQFAYRRITENIRQRYPNAKLMLASWDFIGWWTPQEVQALVKELDPERCIILDYTSEANDPADGFLNWGVVGKFPWIFGLFHAYESENELRGPYDRSDERLKVAMEDPFCKGMILWPELSHSDPLVLEYLAQNAWSPLKMSVEAITERFCTNRYGAQAEVMNDCWQKLLPLIKLGDWGGYSRRAEDDPLSLEYHSSWFAHNDLWSTFTVCLQDCWHDKRLPLYYAQKAERTKPMLADILSAMKQLAQVDDNQAFVLRDTMDLVRTVLGRFMNYLIAASVARVRDKTFLKQAKAQYLKMLATMAELVSLNSDFSIYQTLLELQKTAPVNPDFEKTLKRNINNRYCAQPAYELITQVFVKEAVLAFDWLLQTETDARPNFRHEMRAICKEFIEMPLEMMQPAEKPMPEAAVMKAAQAVEKAASLLF